MKNIKLVATDLDGTFLKNDRTVSAANIDALHKLGEKQIVRVAATGRNLQKVKEVLQPDLPFDYVVFSSGAGVYNWKKKELIANQNIKVSSAQKLQAHFINRDVNFHAFYPVPDNHKHYYYRGKDDCEEFERYFNFNVAHAEPLKIDDLPKGELCQFLIIIKQNEERFNHLKKDIEALCPEIRVIRASSPITPGYIWIEVFHHSVSKGNGVN
jgi:HAD superfamily hydrolase (TIGR01484 family)